MASDLSDPTMLLGSAPVRTEGEWLYAGRYRVERLVGRGGMGAVYRALDVIVGDVVAQILAELHGDPLAGYHRILIGYGRALLGDVDKPEMDAYIRDILRALPGFDPIGRKVRVRVDAMWVL